jgi:hypothetical protein
MARLPVMARLPATASLTSIARDPPTVRPQLTARHPVTTRQTTMARHLITVRRHGRRAEFRMPFRRAVTRVIPSGDAVRGAVDGGRCAIHRSTTRDPTAAMVGYPVQAITAPIEVV